jgi:hypothetical protein
MWPDLRISPEERDPLLDILNTHRGTLRTEIHGTEVSAHNPDLKKKELLDRILGNLHEGKPSGVRALASPRTLIATASETASNTKEAQCRIT